MPVGGVSWRIVFVPELLVALTPQAARRRLRRPRRCQRMRFAWLRRFLVEAQARTSRRATRRPSRAYGWRAAAAWFSMFPFVSLVSRSHRCAFHTNADVGATSMAAAIVIGPPGVDFENLEPPRGPESEYGRAGAFQQSPRPVGRDVEST